MVRAVAPRARSGGSFTLGTFEFFFVRTPRREKARLEPIAYAKQSHVKLKSAAEASATPATTGRRQTLTCDGEREARRRS